MLRNPKLLSSRRAYEYAPDALRLTILSMQPIIDHLKSALSFQLAQVGSPMATFGDVPLTLPPGVIFNFGALPLDEGTMIPIRFLHFESSRIAMDVAGPSSACGRLYEALAHSLERVRASDGSPVIGTPSRILDSSEYSFELDCDSAAFVPSSIREAVETILGARGRQTDDAQLVGSLRLCFQPPDEPFPGSTPSDPFGIQLEVRANSKPEEHVFFSHAPVDSDTHLTFLRRLGDVLAKSG